MNSAPRSLEFPPLLSGEKVAGDPLAAAIASAQDEVEPGLIHYVEDPTTFRVALTLAPEERLERALTVSFAVALGLYDALGALCPPEVACHFGWPDQIKVNGARCGTLRAASSTLDAQAEPDWIVLALEVPVTPRSAMPGGTPDFTTLHDEGCGDVDIPDLIEAFARHAMNWLHIYLTDGLGPVHDAWRTKAEGYGKTITYPEEGTFLGLDELGGLLLKTSETTKVLPLAAHLLDQKASSPQGVEA